MIPRGVFFSFLMILEAAYSLPIEETIEPVEMFHYCIEPERHDSEPEKSPVLLIPPLLVDHRSYEGIDELIASQTKRKVCVVDLRNHGNSPWNNRSDIAAFAVDIGHFLNQHNITKVNLIGESLGGKVAIHYTLNNPDRVDSLIVEEMRPNSIQRVAFRAIKFMVKLAQRFLDSQPENMTLEEATEWALQTFNNLFRGQASMEFPQDVSKFVDLRLIDGKWQPKHNMALLYEKLDKPEEVWTKSTGLYTGPTLFIYGVKSYFKVGEDPEIFELFPNAKLVPLENAGHVIHEMHREFDDIVVKFLNELQ